MWGLTFSSKLDGALTVFLLLKLPPRKLEPCLDLLLPRLLYICINLPYGPAWNTVVMSGWLPLVATCNCQISYKGRYAGLLVLHLLSVSVSVSLPLSLSLSLYKNIIRLIQAYLAPCVTLIYSQTCHIPSPGIFRTRVIFKTLQKFHQAYSELNVVRIAYSAIIQSYSTICRSLCNACICRSLAYLESWNIQNPSIIGSHHIFRTLSYLHKYVNTV